MTGSLIERSVLTDDTCCCLTDRTSESFPQRVNSSSSSTVPAQTGTSALSLSLSLLCRCITTTTPAGIVSFYSRQLVHPALPLPLPPSPNSPPVSVFG